MNDFDKPFYPKTGNSITEFDDEHYDNEPNIVYSYVIFNMIDENNKEHKHKAFYKYWESSLYYHVLVVNITGYAYENYPLDVLEEAISTAIKEGLSNNKEHVIDFNYN